MPNCYSLTKLNEKTPTTLITIDEELCTLLNVIPHSSDWVCNWENTIGLALAMGLDWTAIRHNFSQDGMMTDDLSKIISYLSENYTANAWHQSKRSL